MTEQERNSAPTPGSGYSENGGNPPAAKRGSYIGNAFHGKKFAIGSLILGGAYLTDLFNNEGRGTAALLEKSGLSAAFEKAGNSSWSWLYRNMESARPVLDCLSGAMNSPLKPWIAGAGGISAFVLAWKTAEMMNARSDTFMGRMIGGLAGATAAVALGFACFRAINGSGPSLGPPATKAYDDPRLQPDALTPAPSRELILTPGT